jgi:hypothetical protein
LELHESKPWNIEAVRQSKKKTYASQWSHITYGLVGGIEFLKGKWPFMFMPVGLFMHVEELLDFSMTDVITDSLMSKCPRIMGYLSQTNQFSKATLSEVN